MPSPGRSGIITPVLHRTDHNLKRGDDLSSAEICPHLRTVASRRYIIGGLQDIGGRKLCLDCGYSEVPDSEGRYSSMITPPARIVPTPTLEAMNRGMAIQRQRETSDTAHL